MKTKRTGKAASSAKSLRKGTAQGKVMTLGKSLNHNETFLH